MRYGNGARRQRYLEARREAHCTELSVRRAIGERAHVTQFSSVLAGSKEAARQRAARAEQAQRRLDSDCAVHTAQPRLGRRGGEGSPGCLVPLGFPSTQTHGAESLVIVKTGVAGEGGGEAGACSRGLTVERRSSVVAAVLADDTAATGGGHQ